MSGAEHYREAERLLASYNDTLHDPATRQWSDEHVAQASTLTLAEAQVHATLALAAATDGQTARRIAYQPENVGAS